MPGVHGSAEERFFRHVIKTDSHWFWTGSTNAKGYGQFKAVAGQSPIKAHIFSWKIANPGKTIPKGINVLHRCDIPPCVRPECLFLGTHQDNSDDMVSKNRQAYVGMSVDTIRKIKDQYATEKYSYRNLASQYKISFSTVRDIVKGKYDHKLNRVYKVPGV